MNFKYIKGRVKIVSPVACLANLISFIFFSCSIVILGMLDLDITASTMLAMLCFFSIAFQTYFFKIKGMQESEWVHKKWLRKEHKLTLDQLNQFSQFSYKFHTFIKAVVVLVILFSSATASEAVSPFALLVILGSFFLKKLLCKLAKIPCPAGFLVRQPYGQKSTYFETIDTGPMGLQNNVIRYK